MSAWGRGTTWISVACLLLALVAVSCEPVDHEFLRMTPRARDRAILDKPPEQQVELYLMVVMVEHPPDLGLASAVASNGSKIVPALAKRLAAEERDVAKMHLIDVFVRMEEFSYYPVVEDPKTMALLEQEVAAMEDPFWREMSSDMLARIRAHE